MEDLGGTSLVGRTLAHYQVSSIIGAGGMGEVYRATDTKLARDIALKVLPPEMASDPGRLARFQREARAVAALNHPNVVTVYSVEESDNVHFITMELIEGQPLDRLISANGLPTDRIIEIASAVAEALAAAHEKGIVHRDLKPANVMVTNEGRVKVLDFGLAKDVAAENANDATLTSAGRTQAGMVMGTPAYMSPEQVSGRPLDHRSDIFSFGVVLHEMATGRRPFEGSSSAELISSILRDTAPSVTDARPELPSDLARVVRRCLEKDPRHRVQTARDVSNEFRDLARTVSRSTPLPSSATRVAPLPDSGAARADEGFWVAVLPFKYSGTNAGLMALAEGLSEEVITGLSRFSYLRVIARGSTAKYSSESGDVRAIGKEVSARYVIEGSIRQAGARLRVTVQLGDAASGVRLWTETYERPFDPEAVFNLQDDLVPRIVSTVADWYGVLPHTMSLAVRSKDPALLTPYEALLRSFSYAERVTAEEHVAAKAALKRAVEQSPNSSDCWAMLSILQTDGNIHGLDPAPDSLDDALQSAQRAVDIAPTNHKAYQALAWVRYFRKEFQSSKKAAERAIALNPMDGGALVYVGQTIAFAGDWERGCSLVLRATELNPNHAGWYWYTPFLNAYRKNDYRAALDFALKINMPGFPLACIALAAAHGQLGEIGAAQRALRELLTLRPNYASLARAELRKIWDDQLVEHLIDGLRKAGLEIPEAGAVLSHEVSTSAAGTREKRDSGATRADEGFWVAVLPFKYVGGNPDLAALAEGLTDDVITNMSKFSYLRVIARSSTAQFAQRTVDVRAAARELGARYVMEGSIRQAGARVRIAVQLVDAGSGAGLWAETYDRTFTPEATLDLLDDVVPRIVATVGDTQGILAHSMTEALRNRDPESFTPYEALLRSFGFHQHVSADEHLAGVTALEHAVKVAPDRADCWAMLSWLYRAEYTHKYNARPHPMGRSLEAARRAVNLAPSNQLAHAALASAHFFRRELGEFRVAAERALALNRMEGYTTAFLGQHFAFSGDWERGCALAERSTQLNSNHPGWYWSPIVVDAYRRGESKRALEYALKLNMPGLWTARVILAVVHCQLGQMEQARIAVRDLLALRPDFAAKSRDILGVWWQPEMVEQMLGDLRKAGLEIPSVAATAPPSSGTSPARTASGEARADEGFWVAVLPFKYTGSNPELRALGEGLLEEVITGLSRFSYLRVIARGSTAKYSSESGDVRAIGKELGARYVMEGSLRQAGNKLRLAVQLADTLSGAHIWAETYERAFAPESVFQVQDDLVPRIVSTVADQYGILPRSMSETLRSTSEDGLTPHEAVLRAFSYFARLTPEEHATVRRILERVVRQTPDQADCWAMLAMMYIVEYSDSFNALPKPLERALAAAQRAVDLAPSHALGHYALAWVYFFRKEKAPLQAAVERALALNPMDGSVIGILGLLLHHAGEVERGCQMVEKAMEMNPNYPGVLRFTAFTHAYCQGKYAKALEAAVRINMPGFFYAQAALAAALGQLGQREAAHKAVQDLLALRPDFAAVARREYAKWYGPEDIEHLVDGLRKAGLEIPAASPTPLSGPIQARTASGESRADEGFWVAVLPFKYSGNNADLKALAEGLSEEVITGLSRFSYLRVIARGSTAKYSSESGDVRAIGKELGSRYVMEGSLRQSGSKLRLVVQLVEATTGAHLWAETYERGFKQEAAFELQDELVPRIVSTIADQHGILPRCICAAIRKKSDEQLSPYEAVFRVFGLHEKMTAQEHAACRDLLERVVRDAPDAADCWAMLATLYSDEDWFGFNLRPDPLGRAAAAAQRAAELAPASVLAFQALAQSLFMRHEWQAFRPMAERTIALNPMDGATVALMGIMLACSGHWERGCAVADSAMKLHPNFPGWYWLAKVFNAYRTRDYRAAIDAALHIQMPGYFWTCIVLTAAYGQLGEIETAHKELRELLAVKPNFAATARQELEKWFEAELVGHFLEGLRKARPEIPTDQDAASAQSQFK